jgi:hypothetical protein
LIFTLVHVSAYPNNAAILRARRRRAREVGPPIARRVQFAAPSCNSLRRTRRAATAF